MDKFIYEIILRYFSWEAPYFLITPIVAVIVVAFICVNVLFLIWLERKVCGRIQNRMGPMLNGPRFLARITMWLGGLFQTIWDASKLVLKEIIIPANVDKIVYITAPIIVFTVCLMSYVVIPFGMNLAVKDLNLGLLYIIAISSFTVISILMAGWSSNNKYSLIGGFRSAAQIISYEIPMIFALLGSVLLAGTLKMGDIVLAQKNMWFIIPQCVGFVIYLIAAVAELNRPPFDIPEAESELVSGFNIEYSGMAFAMFFLSEFANMFVVAAVASTVFLGGWLLPFGWVFPKDLTLFGLTVPYFNIIGSVFVFLIKTYSIIFLIMWIRWTYPRLRSDQLMSLSWKILLPTGFLNLMATAAIIKGLKL